MAVKPDAERKGFSPFSLDAVNFLAADVRGAIGPYLNVFLVTRQHWSQSEVGLASSARRSTSPWKSASAPTGSWRGAMPAPKVCRSPSRVRA